MPKKTKKEEIKRREVKEEKSVKNDDRKLYGFLAAFLTIIGFIIALAVKKDDKYVMHYGKQGLVIFIVYVIAALAMMVPILGWIIGVVLYILAGILWIMSWIYALSGEIKSLPILQQFADKINV